MHKSFILFLLLAAAVVFGAAAFAADEEATSTITVKSSEKSSGVVTLQITKESKAFELTCNEGMPSCADLKKGSYKMVELPKNHGIYECKDVRIYSDSSTASEDDDKLGEYCLITK
ncbi:MAG: hypothetical protein ACXVZV_04645 [Terriglobales bacterium]